MSQLTQLTYVQQMAIADFMTSSYPQIVPWVANKHAISADALRYHLCVEHGKLPVQQREDYCALRQGRQRRVHKTGVVCHIRPSWYTGNPQIKWVPRHHILWCLAQRVTCKPPYDVLWNADGNYADAPPEAYQLLTKSEHRRILNQRHTATSK
jgi:hypothetical protein